MPLKEKTIRLRKPPLLEAYAYRLPLPVREVLQYSNGACYPICPRCDRTMEREYMSYCDRCGQRLAWVSFSLARVVPAPRRGKKSP